MDKEKIVRELVDTFSNRSELHKAYKEKMKLIIKECIHDFLVDMVEKDNFLTTDQLENWIDNFVETRF